MLPTPRNTSTATGASDTWPTIGAAIASRRSVKAFLPRPVPRALLADLIDLAVWAPNHRLNEPWRFYVLDGASRARLGEAAARQMLLRLSTAPGVASVDHQRRAAEATASWAEVPALVYLTVLGDPDPDVDRENYAAACCAAQNFMLAATAAGLGTSWSSGALAASSDLRALAGATSREQMVGLFRIGYPDPAAPAPPSRRKPGANWTVWVDGSEPELPH